MCGMSGMAGDIQKEDRDLFKGLLIVNTLRGLDSAGIASANDKGETDLFKQAVPAYDLVTHKQFDQVADWGAQVLLGHTRAATVGKVNRMSAHPFDIGGVIGCHNGTLRNWYDLEDYSKFDVDSEALIYNIGKLGWEETFARITGAWAVTVYDPKEHKLHIMRNKERPLHIAYKADGSVMYWASEDWMLPAMAERFGVRLSEKKVFQPAANTLWTWQLPDRKYTKEFPKAQTRKIEVKEEKKEQPPYDTYRYNRGGAHYSQTGGQGGYQTPHQPVKNNVVPFNPERFDNALQGTWLEFMPVSVGQSKVSGQFYLEGLVDNEAGWTVKMYCSSKAAYEMMEAEKIYGNVIGITQPLYDSDGWLCIQANTAQVLEWKTEEEEEKETILYEGPNGKLIDEDTFLRLTEKGCGNCNGLITKTEEIEWVGDSPICEDCIDNVNKWFH